MSSSSQNPDFLKKFRLKNLPPKEREAIESAAERAEKREGRRINRSDTTALIQNYIARFKEVLDRPDPAKRQRGLEQLKSLLHDQFLITPKEVPASFFDAIKRRHREEGHGNIDIPADLKSELMETAISDQRQSLDTWIDYLSSPDAKYPDSLKYFTFRSILKMGRFDKEKHTFTNREGRGTVSPFPELNREALAVILEDMEKKYKGETTNFTFTTRYDIAEPEKQAYREALNKENFATLYALAIDAFKPISDDLLQVTEGQWRTYPKGSDPKSLVASIANYGTGWCLRGEPTARRYLESNDLHIYYSNDTEGNPVVPRVVMVINQANQITEVRGIEKHEHLDSHINTIVEQKLSTHPDGTKYQKKSSDMKRLTAIDHKTKQKESLSKEDLLFLYEMDSRIEGFGYEAAGRDPRIEEIRSQRNLKEDLPILFDCTLDQIATSPKEVSPYTKAYIGTLEPGIFHLLNQYNIDHIYASFPEGRIRQIPLTIGGKSSKELEQDLQHAKIKVNSGVSTMMHHRDFTTLKSVESITLVHLTVKDLGFPTGATTDQIFARAKELGLDLCPAEVGPHYRLSYIDQPMNEWVYVGMKQIAASAGLPHVFELARHGHGLWLHDTWAEPSVHWHPGRQFVFCLRPSTPLPSGLRAFRASNGRAGN